LAKQALSRRAALRQALWRFRLGRVGDEGVVFRSRFLFVVWVVIGIIVAATHDYFEKLDTVRLLLSAVLAILLWPLVLLGIDLHIRK
jgi:hypothetical protein